VGDKDEVIAAMRELTGLRAFAFETVCNAPE
jgi:hypothetical protein